jgi:hypothetical protein
MLTLSEWAMDVFPRTLALALHSSGSGAGKIFAAIKGGGFRYPAD